MRTLLTIGLAAIAIAAAGALGPAFAGEGDDPRSSYVDDNFTYVPLQLRGGKPATVRRIYLNIGGQVLEVDPAGGVERFSQNRLDWSGIPFIGQFANDRYNEADFAAGRSIGDAYFDEGTVWLDLSDEAQDATYPRVEFLNQSYAYRLKAPLAPNKSQSLPGHPPGEQIGVVFRGNDGSLLVLVRPFIVTDTPF